MKTIETHVLIVGAGPTGLTCAALLAREGVAALTITRHRGLAHSPRAHIINQRAMEVFRDLGIEDRVIAAAPPGKLMGQVVWAESFSGREIARRKSWGAGADRLSDYAAASPSDLCNIHQHILEPIMAEAAVELGAPLRYRFELTAMRQDGERVISQCVDRDSGESIEVISRYAIGADGDNSVVCREIGFAVEGKAGLGPMLNYWIKADLAPYVADRPGALYQIFRPDGAASAGMAVFVNVAPWDEWVMSMPYDPAREPDVSAAEATRLARHFAGDPALEVELIAASRWTINQIFARTMRKDRVLIAGNAAHRHPPAGGLGANTCIQDAYNLAWKLALVLKGQAGAAILDSYDAERQPIAKQIVLRANQSMRALFAMSDAVGFRPGQSATEAAAALDALYAPTPEGGARRRALGEALRQQDYNFNALGVELGQFYRSDAVIADGEPPLPRDPEIFYLPSATPGAPLPHALLARGGKTLSTLDLVGRGRFTLLAGLQGQGWVEAARALAQERGWPLDALTIGLGAEIDDIYGDWARRREIDETGCLLVRPDRIIAFRARQMAADPAFVLTAALEKILAL